ncbi:hypothetical protein KBB06_02250 [Candidatus Gracilibacteria bacterium]|nr:hypothetical protein [Candidatus Gracilibacteria bacterium]
MKIAKKSNSLMFNSMNSPAAKVAVLNRLNVGSFLSLLFLAALLFLALQPHTARAASNTCFDIRGSGKYVSVGGVNNSGMVMFDPNKTVVPQSPEYQYEACAEDPGNDGVAPFVLKGWAWDDNLGWISMFCDGTTVPLKMGKNLGIDCGYYTYGVTVDANGKFSGYAYGDNSGYISFQTAFSQLAMEVNDAKCQGYVYTDPFNSFSGTACPATHTAAPFNGKQSTSVWSDNVGWIDLDGVLFPWYTLTQSLTDVSVVISPVPSQADENPATDSIRAGEGGYTLTIKMKDRNGAYVTGPRYTVYANPDWLKDTVKKDQTIKTDKLLATPDNPCSSDTRRAVTKPCTQVSTGFGLTYAAGDYNFTNNIESIAPTSNENKTKASDNTWFSNEGFIYPSDLNGVESNDLVLQDVGVKVYDNDADQCAYGEDFSTCTFKLLPVSTYSPLAIRFKPPMEIKDLNNDLPGNPDILTAFVGLPKSFNPTVSGSGTVEWSAGMMNDPNYKFGFIDVDPKDAKFADIDQQKTGYTSGPFNMLFGFKGQQASQYVGGFYLYSKIRSGEATYYGSKLPRTLGTFGAQPTAVILGSIYSSGAIATTKTAGAIVSLGDITTNQLEAKFRQNVAAIVGDDSTLIPGTVTITDLNNCATNPAVTSGTLKCLQNGTVFYGKGDILLTSSGGGPLTWSGEKTIISNGGNVYINADLYNALLSTPKQRLGIIVLKDLGRSPKPAFQGNIYIDAAVRDIQANIFASGSVFSYNPAGGVTADAVTGLPNFSSTTVANNILNKRQLWITGSLASYNTIGGSVPTTATGDKIMTGLGQEATTQLEAQLYDLNFLRQYVGELMRDPATQVPMCGNPAVMVASDAELYAAMFDAQVKPKAQIDGGCLIKPATGMAAQQNNDADRQLGSTYIKFDPPTPTLPGFAPILEFYTKQGS